MSVFTWFANKLAGDLNHFHPRISKSILPPAQTAPSWQLVWGSCGASSETVVWQDDYIAFLASSRPVLSSSQRFVLVGDVWLPTRSKLWQNLDSVPLNRQKSDLDLVAHLWEWYGTETWAMLEGAFALAIWDRERQVLWLGRDRSGIYTLYYTIEGATRRVAPQLHPLTAHCSRDLDLVALRDYLCCAFVPGSRTLWQSIREVRPGTSINLTEGTTHPYWRLQEQPGDFAQPLAWHGDRLRSLLEHVIQEYLPAGEPLGVFLSGGLDSSCITALAAKFHDAPVHTYSIHFGHQFPNELEFSGAVAAHCQTHHSILEISLPDMWSHLPETMAFLDDPIGDPLTVPNLLLGRLAQKSVRVVLNGEGGDPCFGGPKNQPMLLNSLYSTVNQQGALQAYLMSFQKCAADLPQLLQPGIWSKVEAAPSPFFSDLHSSDRYLNRLMALNIKFKGADHILTKVNNLTRAAGIEGRSPLFDPRVVDLSMQIPPEYKLSGVQEKAVLKQAVTDLLPDFIIHRPKSGMMVPVHIGFRDYWNRQARQLLLSKRAAIAPYLNQSLICDWLNYQGDTWNRYGVKLWLLVSLELWLAMRGFQ
ncbi:asparagine synthase [Leptothermofonsia sichuanensis E412]|uniref:asparagine synthetase B family protein n=1 Tax=Leptothermofonsia sichuanensis TaxID=2917832 RepID=UPI001CA64E39|nr:asparagine synthase-related protein [Leptothermofonsia sichuanensis]QZZ22547.1 asparagine synthase [Leptothermofonsia sichuanensis E412]